MRRILLGGLGIALGVFTPPLLAQQPAQTPPTRAAKLGRPSAIPSTPTPGDSQVQPAGLLGAGSAQPTTSYAPGSFGTPTPVIAQPPGSVTSVPGTYPSLVNSGGAPTVQPATPGTTGPVTGAPPMVIETRDPTGRIPTGTVVPSVMPDGSECPDIGLEDPIYNDGTPPGGLLGGLGRLRSCGRSWMSAETLLWWNKGTQVPPLVTTSSPQYNGIIGQGDTQVLLGGSFGSTFHVGARLGGGYWFNDNQCRGFDWRVFWVAPASSTYTATDPPYALLARPFTNVNPNVASIPAGPSSEVVAGPGVATGAVTAVMKSTIWGAEANYRRFLLGNGTTTRLDLLAGYRYLDLAESLTITESFTRIPNSNLNVGTDAISGVVFDRFRTENHFNGGQVGFAGTVQRGRWSLDSRATLAMGSVSQSADITGGQALTFANGSVQTASGGLLALPSNIGHYSQTRFAVVPEIGLNVGYQVTSRLKLYVGYNFLYLSSAVRPGSVVDQSVDVARIPNFLPAGTAAPVSPHPLPQLNTSGYFIQGINFGLTYRW